MNHRDQEKEMERLIFKIGGSKDDHLRELEGCKSKELP